MIISVIEAISIKLNSIFGDEYEIYLDNVEQGLERPCFYIKDLSVQQNPLLGDRVKHRNNFDIHFFPRGNKKSELLEVATILFEELVWIDLLDGSTLKGIDMSCQTVDSVLHFMVSYNLHLDKDIPYDKMENLSVEGGVKNG